MSTSGSGTLDFENASERLTWKRDAAMTLPEAVHYRVGDGLVVDPAAPVFNSQLAGDYGRVARCAVNNHLERIVSDHRIGESFANRPAGDINVGDLP